MKDNRRTRGWYTPTPGDVDGISLYDTALTTPHAVKQDARHPDDWRVIEISEQAFWELGLTVSPTLIDCPVDELPGHVQVPDFSIQKYSENKPAFRAIQDALLDASSDFVD